MINFLAEISKNFTVTLWPLPSTDYSKEFDIYELDIGPHPVNTYWTEWGGHYDNFSGYSIELYYEKFLSVKDTIGEVLVNSFSMIIIGRKVYFNVPKYTWFYLEHKTEYRIVYPFLSSALNPEKPSNNIIGFTHAPVRLEIPSVNIKLSDNFNGITLNQSFSINLLNNDGYFDSEEELQQQLFNTPIRLKKSVKEISEYADFKNLKEGFIENVFTTFDRFQVTAGDPLKSMTNPVCGIVSSESFPDINLESEIGKNIPVLYGQKRIKLFKINETQYIPIVEKITSIDSVYDKEGNQLESSQYTVNESTGVITVTGSSISVDMALITGYTNNKIGEIIKDLIIRRAKIDEGPTNFNENEINHYINTLSPRINILIESGDVKSAINNVLKSDIAYFIQQLDGKFTIRKYGETYNSHYIPSWLITQKPEKDYSKAQNDFFSSCRINYNFIDKDTYLSFLYDEREIEAEDTYKKISLKTFDTCLTNIDEAKDFALLLGKRYIKLKQTVKIALGMDTSNMNLLDTVEIQLNINGRNFSKVSKFFIKEINPCQDILFLEEI